jgi:putative endonuclease
MEPKIGVYILLCRNGRFYTGSTDDLNRRLVQHHSGRVKATKNLLPLKIVGFIPCIELKEARALEYKIKKMKSSKYIDSLINQY